MTTIVLIYKINNNNLLCLKCIDVIILTLSRVSYSPLPWSLVAAEPVEGKEINALHHGGPRSDSAEEAPSPIVGRQGTLGAVSGPGKKCLKVSLVYQGVSISR